MSLLNLKIELISSLLRPAAVYLSVSLESSVSSDLSLDSLLLLRVKLGLKGRICMIV